MKIGSAFPSKYIKESDLQGHRVTVTIDSVTMEDIGEEDQKPVVYFKGKEKGLILNRTNANMISEIAGDEETDAWDGVRVVLFPTKTDFGGKRVPCIRIEAPADSKPKPSADDGDDASF